MRTRSKYLVLSFAAALAVAVLMPASSATAVYTPVGGIATDSTQAGAHPNLTTTYTQAAKTAITCGVQVAPSFLGSSLCAQPDVKTIAQTFPRGVLADANAAPFCTPTSVPAALGVGTVTTCPADTQVGTQTLVFIVCGTAACQSTIAGGPFAGAPYGGTGKVYNASPTLPDGDGTTPSRQGHLIVLTTPSGTGPNSRLDISVTIADGDTLQTSVSGISGNGIGTPTGATAPDLLPVADAYPFDGSAGGPACTVAGAGIRICDIHPTLISLTFTGATGEGIGHAVVTNPTADGTRTFSQTMTSHGTTPETASNTADYSTTGADSLSFAPTFDVALSTTKAGEVPGITASATQAANEAADKATKVTFPGFFKVSQGSALTPCSAVAQSTGHTTPTCDAAAKLGTVSATAPAVLAGSSESGDLFLGETTGSQLFNLIANLGGYFPLVVRGTTVTDSTNANVVTELPDIPLVTLTSFTLALNGSTGGILKNPTICAPMTVTGEFTSHSGKTGTASKTINITDCASPKAKLSASPNKRGKHPKLTMEASSAGTILASTTLDLNRGGTIMNARRLRHGASAAATRLGNLTVTTNSTTLGDVKTKVKLNYKRSKSSNKKVVMTGKLNGETVTVTLRVSSGPKVTFKGLPSTTDYLSGVKLQLLGGTRNWLTLGSRCRKNKVTAKTKDVYGTHHTARKKLRCKR